MKVNQDKLDKVIATATSLAFASIILVVITIIHLVLLSFTGLMENGNVRAGIYIVYGITLYHLVKCNYLFLTLYKKE